jgi:hypothetical protein
MVQQSRFVQISAAVVPGNALRKTTVLFALDEDGNVWEYKPKGFKKPAHWAALATERER